jgi:flavin reductase (DIM6/NTAB) family NADH-FMN oxidoreductase RutF
MNLAVHRHICRPFAVPPHTAAENLRRERECVLNLVPASMVDVVDRLAKKTTGQRPVRVAAGPAATGALSP